MKVVIQRVKSASVLVNQEIVGSIQKGLLLFVGIAASDDVDLVTQYIEKIIKLRIFEDENGKTNRSLQDVGGELLVVSQFTLYADCKKGNRPSFTAAAPPVQANDLYEVFLEPGTER